MRQVVAPHSKRESLRYGSGTLELPLSLSRVHPTGLPPAQSPAAITLAWIAKLRWGAVVGQLTTIIVASVVLGLALPMPQLLALCAASAASNVALSLWLRRAKDVPSRVLGMVLTADILVLYGLLYHSGGPSNPFSVFYLVHITLAALVLGMRWAGAVVALSAASYAALFFWHVPIPGMEHMHHGGGAAYSTHLQGMWVAFVLSASLIAYFVSRVAAALRQRDEDLAAAQAIVAKSERLASLTTLAAGAAHELGSPLATIAVVANELERSLRDAAQSAAKEDAHLIRMEVERCRGIIQRMGAQAGGTLGEVPESVLPSHIWDACLAKLPKADAARIERGPDGAMPITCHVNGLVQVVVCLLQNAIEATRDTGGAIRVLSEQTADWTTFQVTDKGHGIPDSIVARVGEPFFTTKATGEGMGLGLFLARTFAERARGALSLDTDQDRGTVARLRLPMVVEAGGG